MSTHLVAVRVEDNALSQAMSALAAAQSAANSSLEATALQGVNSRSTQLSAQASNSARRRINLVNILAAVVGLAFLVILLKVEGWPWKESDPETRAAVWTALIVFIAYAVLGAIHWKDGGLVSYIRGKDGRLSTSLLQVGLWTFAVSAALVYFVVVALYSADPAGSFKTSLGGNNLPEEYLLVLGGPFAAAVLARLTVGAKVADEELQKVDANAKLIDVVSDDDGRANLVDAQFLVFNIVALTWFVGALIDSPSKLPDIPDLLVGLTSISAIGFVAAKGVASNRPVVTSVIRLLDVPSENAETIRPGDPVEIRGANFVPPGAGSQELLSRIVVKFGDTQVTPTFVVGDRSIVRSPRNELIIARVPQSVGPGVARVSVVTAAGIESESREMTVVEDKPVITGLDPPSSTPGGVIKVLGRNFRRSVATDNLLPSIRFGSVLVQANSWFTDGNRSGVEVTVPAHLATGNIDVSVRADRGSVWSETAPLMVT